MQTRTPTVETGKRILWGPESGGMHHYTSLHFWCFASFNFTLFLSLSEVNLNLFAYFFNKIRTQ